MTGPGRTGVPGVLLRGALLGVALGLAGAVPVRPRPSISPRLPGSRRGRVGRAAHHRRAHRAGGAGHRTHHGGAVSGQITYLPEAQWSDRLPSLLHARTIQAFENGSKLRRVARPGDGVVGEYQLNLDIRTFGVRVTAGAPDAVVELSAKVIQLASGTIVAAQVFSARVPVSAMNGPGVTAALDAASNKVLTDVVMWSSSRF